ncbi:uncharacterized protein L969DRAFT_15214 [Mixia osmundae IAM 14324]|uniref:Nucleolar GTP-binding protein 2 n=1 Tax=Mixia osmundae (strain CBS 9802 / IAM 14324 / JCM 22182 / KY 12970) TaxID=764103 RepID=G7DXK7_MIXOS|nr:uncharacterized protein L969DRAFT_15214 [Mixia osmundae IAM 14324]KEI41189.1 hypothetical protein L969DRAFT_15214 [Mixia osmundae IAM 14324]GAA95317.1 hypothetical protein E5Q_01974 [Mixia osmundae IAM 14324]
MAGISKARQTAQHTKGENHYRDGKKVRQLKMLSSGHKAIRDKDGKILKAAPFQSKEVTPGRVQPDRRWFGNTRVISQTALDHFRTSLGARQNDPFAVVLKQNKLPLSLLQESTKVTRPDLAVAEPFADTFGPKSQRKRPRLDAANFEEMLGASQAHNQRDSDAQEALHVAAEEAHAKGDDPVLPADDANDAPLDKIMSAGTSKRIWGELYKVIDSSDVILHVLDARDPLGTRCESVEKYLAKEKRGKKVVYILNKVDLIPGWAAARWVKYLSQFHPTIAFHASITNSFGKGSLITLLRQFSVLFSDKKQISVGFVGYPNVGKSSIINTLKRKKVCNVAPIPGETKVWQYITLMRRLYLIDCPGIVPPSSRDSETQKVLKGVVRVEHLSSPSDHLPPLLERVRPEYITRTYGVKGWKDPDQFLAMLAKKRGKLGPGGEPELDTVAKIVLNDWIRGKIPYFVRPPDTDGFLAAQQESAEQDQIEQAKQVGMGKLRGVTQPLHQIVRSNAFLAEDEQSGAIAAEAVDDDAPTDSSPAAVPDDEAEAAIEEEVSSDDEEDGEAATSSEDETGAIDSGSEGELTWDDLVGSKPAPEVKAEQALVDSDDGERPKKEPRMKTLKRKAENFYTSANVKNRNRSRTVPKQVGKRSRR